MEIAKGMERSRHFLCDTQQGRGAPQQPNVPVPTMGPWLRVTSAGHPPPCLPLSLDGSAIGLDLWVLFYVLGGGAVFALALSVILCSALHIYSLHKCWIIINNYKGGRILQTGESERCWTHYSRASLGPLGYLLQRDLFASCVEKYTFHMMSPEKRPVSLQSSFRVAPGGPTESLMVFQRG